MLTHAYFSWIRTPLNILHNDVIRNGTGSVPISSDVEATDIMEDEDNQPGVGGDDATSNADDEATSSDVDQPGLKASTEEWLNLWFFLPDWFRTGFEIK